MLLTRANKGAIVITIEDFADWTDIFDNEFQNEISFDLDNEILDVFFPIWETYIDSNNPFWTLRQEDVSEIKTIIILIASDAPELKDFKGEGIYNVIKSDCDLGNTVIEDGGDEPTYRDFLDFAGTVTFKITPKQSNL